jgi:2-polyprenyl-6-methoxyphenol hydroxylase-like FAD-dependent oxidoreductase
MERQMNYEVVIAGAGPVGLFLACELGLAGVSVVVLEKMKDTRTPLKENPMGMRGMNLPSTEAFYRRGMLKEVRGTAIGWMTTDARDAGMAMRERQSQDAPRFAGHFAGILLDGRKIDFGGDKYALGGPSAAGGMVTLAGIEDVLQERAEELGVEIRLGSAVTSVSQMEDGVSVEVGGETIQAKWLVGCDGGRSAVRKLSGFEFVGTDPEVTGYIAMGEIEGIEKLSPGWTLTPRGLRVNGPVPGRFGMVEFGQSPADRDAPPTLEVLQAVLRRVSGTDVTLRAVHIATSYTDNARQATTYRKGRVLLAGDAAHVHSPLGGQGMNLGIGDAMNLGWKLAATVKGWAPEDLLDTYTQERHPIGAWALDWTRAQVSIMRPDPHAQAMQAVVRELIETTGGATFFAQKIAGTWLRYPLPGDHELIGRSAPDFEFEDGRRLGDLLREGRGVLLDFAGEDSLASMSEGWKGCVKYARGAAKNSLGLSAALVRPDGFVVWASESEPDADLARMMMQRWFGSPLC